MSVPVLFPDGTKRRVMAELRLKLDHTPDVATGAFVLCPINADPTWQYLWRKGQWIAHPRFGVPAKAPAIDMPPWWAGIASMADDNGVQSRDTPVGPRRRAA